MGDFLRKFRKQEKSEDLVDIGECNDPVQIFGVFRKSNQRSFTRTCVVMDIRPFEDWDRFLERKIGEHMHWLDRPRKNNLSILFECKDGSRIMGIINTVLFNSLPKITVGDRCTVSGVFEFAKLLKDQDVYLFFRIKDWSK